MLHWEACWCSIGKHGAPAAEILLLYCRHVKESLSRYLVGPIQLSRGKFEVRAMDFRCKDRIKMVCLEFAFCSLVVIWNCPCLCCGCSSWVFAARSLPTRLCLLLHGGQEEGLIHSPCRAGEETASSREEVRLRKWERFQAVLFCSPGNSGMFQLWDGCSLTCVSFSHSLWTDLSIHLPVHSVFKQKDSGASFHSP